MSTGDDETDSETVPEQGSALEGAGTEGVGASAGGETGADGAAAEGVAAGTAGDAGADTAEPPAELIEATKPAAVSLVSELKTIVALADCTVTELVCEPVRVCTGVPLAELPL